MLVNKIVDCFFFFFDLVMWLSTGTAMFKKDEATPYDGVFDL